MALHCFVCDREIRLLSNPVAVAVELDNRVGYLCVFCEEALIRSVSHSESLASMPSNAPVVSRETPSRAAEAAGAKFDIGDIPPFLLRTQHNTTDVGTLPDHNSSVAGTNARNVQGVERA
jgi:hypothetical protein